VPLFGGRRPSYGWAGPLEGNELDEFLRQLRADLDARGWRYEIGDEALEQLEPERRELGLGNLAQGWRLAEPDERPGVVREHFDNLAAAAEDEIPTDFETARPLLRVRIAAPDYVAYIDAPMARPVADGLVAVLAVDSPTAAHLVSREVVAPWGRGEDELFAAGLAGVREEEGLATQAFDVQGARLTALTGESLYTATWALWADELDPPAAGHGTLVAVPHRHTVLVHAIRDTSAIVAASHLARMAASMHREGPGSISPGVYWVRDGEFERVPTIVRDGDVTLVPSDELIELLNSLD
jgi:hypothetical protein